VCVHWLADISENCVTVDSKFCFDNVYFCAHVGLMPLPFRASKLRTAHMGSLAGKQVRRALADGISSFGLEEISPRSSFPLS
jgi:hypothetical protein